MTIPKGLQSSHPHKVFWLVKSLYVLKQASRQWNNKLALTLLGYGFQRSAVDHSLFFMKSGDVFVVLLVYVEDVIVASTSMEAISSIKQYLHNAFQIKDLGELKYFLGLEVSRTPSRINLC